MKKIKILTGYHKYFIGNYIGDFGINKNFYYLLKSKYDVYKLPITLLLRQNIYFLIYKISSKYFLKKRLSFFIEYKFRLIPRKYLSKYDYFFSHGFVFDYNNNISYLYADQDKPKFLDNKFLISKFLFNKLDFIFTTTSFSLENINKNLGSKKKILINNYPDSEMLNPIGKDDFELKIQSLSKKIKVLFVGKDLKRKGYDIIYKLANKYINEQIEFHIVSSNKLSNKKNIYYYSNISNKELLDLYKTSHIFLFPTSYDTFGRVLIEAMSKNCMIITANRGPQISITDRGKYGFNVDTDDFESHLKLFNNFLKNKNLIIEYMNLSYINFKENFSNEEILKKFNQILVHDKVS